MAVRVAVASSDGKFINQHFGHAQQFLIFEIDDEGKYEFIELRENVPTCSGGDHTSGALESTLDIIKDTQIVLISQIGPGASQFLLLNGIQPYMIPTFIEEALDKLSARLVKTTRDNVDDPKTEENQ